MTTSVAIFDNTRDLERAVEQLAAAGFEDTVYDEGILAQESGNAAAAASAPRSAPNVLLRSVQPNLSPQLDRHNIMRAFRHHLADYHLPEDVIEAYATTFYHSSKPTPHAPSKPLRSSKPAAQPGLTGMTTKLPRSRPKTAALAKRPGGSIL